jgi:carbon-monoxide dehydrogenase medium subunit
VIPKFDYHKPTSVQEVVELLSKLGGEAKVFAGGTDLFVLMRDRLIRPKHLVDIKGVSELGRISFDEAKGLRIGAAVTFVKLLDFEPVRERFQVLWSAVEVLGDPILRNRATLVGNICNASPAADSAPPLLVLDAEVEVLGREPRVVPIREFFRGVKQTVLRPGEFVSAVRVPTPPKGSKGKYYKWGRTRGEDLAVVGVAIQVNEEKSVRIALSSVYKTPIRITAVEEIFKKDAPIKEKIKEAVRAVQENIFPISDVRGSKEYRLHMAGVLTGRGLRELLGVR